MNGKCDLLYDAPFVFAEVNADIVHWGRERDGEWTIIRVDKSAYVSIDIIIIFQSSRIIFIVWLEYRLFRIPQFTKRFCCAA